MTDWLLMYAVGGMIVKALAHTDPLKAQKKGRSPFPDAAHAQ
jgi:hypothetical protein